MDTSRILEQRAERLARKGDEPEDEPGIEVVEFLLGRERYGLEIGWTSGVHALQRLTPLPGTPGFILGITALRGQIISVTDLAVLFELPRRDLSDSSKIIVLSSREMELAVLTDDILGVTSVPWSSVQSSITTFNGPLGRYLKGVSLEGLILLDGEKILTDPDLVVSDKP